MSSLTPRLGLIKPSGSDDIEASIISQNYDKIDTALGSRISADYTVVTATRTSDASTALVTPVGIPIKKDKVYLINAKIYMSFTSPNTSIKILRTGAGSLKTSAGYGWVCACYTSASVGTVSALQTPETTLTITPPSTAMNVYDVSGVISPTVDMTYFLSVATNTAVTGTLTLVMASYVELTEVS